MTEIEKQQCYLKIKVKVKKKHKKNSITWNTSLGDCELLHFQIN